MTEQSETQKTKLDEMLAALAERFPVFESRAWEPHWPLARGIHREIWKRWPDVSHRKLSMAMHAYTSRRQYLVALANGGARFDLDGNPSGIIDDDEIEDARQKLVAAGTAMAAGIQAWKTRMVRRSPTKSGSRLRRQSANPSGTSRLPPTVSAVRERSARGRPRRLLLMPLLSRLHGMRPRLPRRTRLRPPLSLSRQRPASPLVLQ